MINKLQNIIKKYEHLNVELMDPRIASDVQKSIEINKEMSNLQEAYRLAKEYVKYHQQLLEANEMIETENDEDMQDMAKTEKKEAENKLEELEKQLKVALLPKDPNDDKNIYLEIRPAAGGDEAGLFAAELLRMYMAFAQKKGWKPEIVEEQLSDIGGVKFVMVKISGEKVYSIMKFESGVHRVQRIPNTESQGRVHTSTVTVAIMPEVKDVSVNLDMKDIVLDTYAGSSS
ncbi:MAG: PCRF domain-containing protein [bacterium]|nr:PCRF domain-containing protein [bacterium]